MAEKELLKTSLSRAMALCARRELCTNDMRDILRSWGLGNDDAEKIITRLIQEKFINEERYSYAFTKDKFNYNKWGKIKIAAHLRATNVKEHRIKAS